MPRARCYGISIHFAQIKFLRNSKPPQSIISTLHKQWEITARGRVLVPMAKPIFPFKSLTSIRHLMINECENTEMIEPREFKMQNLNFLLHQNYSTHHSHIKDKSIHWMKKKRKYLNSAGNICFIRFNKKWLISTWE